MAKEIRLLTASEIECRVGQTGKNGNKAWCSLLLYKDARCDQKILDEVFGMFGWKRKHEEIKGQLCCIVSIYDDAKKQWIDKEDVGVESNTEAVKGSFSDSFKRACFNIGIGRELYTAPRIFISLNEGEYDTDSYGKVKLNARTIFDVKEIDYDENRNSSKLVIVDQSGKVRYTLGQSAGVQQQSFAAPKTDIYAGIKEKLAKAETEAECRKIWDENVKFQKDSFFVGLVQNRLKEIGV